jgi:hypothetical protein
MGITSITSLTPLSVARAIQADLDPLPMQRVENSPKTGDKTYSPSNGESTRGSADDAPEDDMEDFADESADEPPNPSGNASQTGPISFFA